VIVLVMRLIALSNPFHVEFEKLGGRINIAATG
jgi:hypothetical protein